MWKALDCYDWAEAFCYADKAPPVAGASCSAAGFTREDVETIVAISEGDNDGPNWLIVVLLRDGRFGFLSAGCDYTGWDCQAGGSACSAETLRQLIRFGLDEDARDRLGLRIGGG